eukprot:SAG31_NODE_238_length_19470_cov_8.921532_9_plen_365_part_00
MNRANRGIPNESSTTQPGMTFAPPGQIAGVRVRQNSGAHTAGVTASQQHPQSNIVDLISGPRGTGPTQRSPFFTDMSKSAKPFGQGMEATVSTFQAPGAPNSPQPQLVSVIGQQSPPAPNDDQPNPSGQPDTISSSSFLHYSRLGGDVSKWTRARRYPTLKPQPLEGMTTSRSDWARQIVDQLREHAGPTGSNSLLVDSDLRDSDAGTHPTKSNTYPPPVPVILGGDGVPPPPPPPPTGHTLPTTVPGHRRRRAYPTRTSQVRPAVLNGFSAYMLSDLDGLGSEVVHAVTKVQAAARGFLQRVHLRSAWGEALIDKAVAKARLRSRLRVAGIVVLGQTGRKQAVRNGRRRRRSDYLCYIRPLVS